MQSDNNRSAIGFLTMSESYLRSAEALIDQMENNTLGLRHDAPIDFLIAHALELNLKSALIVAGATPDNLSEKYAHNLLVAYDACRDELPKVISATEEHVRGKWRVNLRKLRDNLIAELKPFGSEFPDHGKSLGIPTNSQIGDELPELRKQVIWLDERHSRNGSEFRYLKTGLVRRSEYRVGNARMDSVRYSALWGTAFLGSQIEEILQK